MIKAPDASRWEKGVLRPARGESPRCTVQYRNGWGDEEGAQGGLL